MKSPRVEAAVEDQVKACRLLLRFPLSHTTTRSSREEQFNDSDQKMWHNKYPLNSSQNDILML